MTEVFIQIMFGWPAIITAILLSIIGVVIKRPVMLVIAGIVCLPFTYYISNGLRNPAVSLPLFQFASAFAISRQRNVLAWLMISPLIVIATMLAYVVLTQYQ